MLGGQRRFVPLGRHGYYPLVVIVGPVLELIPMQILISKPQLERFIESQISEGRFTTGTDVVEAALVRLMESDIDEALDHETCKKILRGNEQIDRGEGLEVDEVMAQLRSRYSR